MKQLDLDVNTQRKFHDMIPNYINIYWYTIWKLFNLKITYFDSYIKNNVYNNI